MALTPADLAQIAALFGITSQPSAAKAAAPIAVTHEALGSATPTFVLKAPAAKPRAEREERVGCAYGTCAKLFLPHGIGRWAHRSAGCKRGQRMLTAFGKDDAGVPITDAARGFTRDDVIAGKVSVED